VSTELKYFDYPAVEDSSANPYRRECIPNDREVAPYTLTGFKRIVFLAFYALIVASSIGGMIYTFYISPWFALAILPGCYVFNNLLFLVNHSRLHASFIELPEEDMSVICHHSFIHHYRNICVYHETWLETRMSYFMDARTVFDRAFRGFVLGIPMISLLLYRIDPVLGIGFFSSQYLAELLQSTIHEWYHNPIRNRKTFYSFPVYWICTLMEKTELASTKRHLDHHRHQLPSLEKVETWLDLYVPFGEIPVSRYWKKALAKYVPGQTCMTDYISRVGALYAYSMFFLINPAIYVLIYIRYFR
jgi:hypothetical protein